LLLCGISGAFIDDRINARGFGRETKSFGFGFPGTALVKMAYRAAICATLDGHRLATKTIP
jgi:hypothetical protein